MDARSKPTPQPPTGEFDGNTETPCRLGMKLNMTLERILSERPDFHALETEIEHAFDPAESVLPRKEALRLSGSDLTCYGIGADVLRFVASEVNAETRSLETGAGCSTLVFAVQRARHTAITPSLEEIRRIRDYATKNEIHLDSVTFVAEPSDQHLPRCSTEGLDIVLLDGKHAFPWPILDWFFTAHRLKRGGLLLLDDVQLRSVAVLAEFLSADPGWKRVRDFSGKTILFQKTRERVLDVAWHMQPWTTAASRSRARRILRAILGRLRNSFRGW